MKEVRYMISDAAKKINVEPHVLRYWEEELGTEIPRNEMGHRYYREEDIQMMRGVKYLKEKGFQLKSIKILLPEVDKTMQLPQRRLLELRDRLELAVSQEELRLQREEELKNYSGQEQGKTIDSAEGATSQTTEKTGKDSAGARENEALPETDDVAFYVAAAKETDAPDDCGFAGEEEDRNKEDAPNQKKADKPKNSNNIILTEQKTAPKGKGNNTPAGSYADGQVNALADKQQPDGQTSAPAAKQQPEGQANAPAAKQQPGGQVGTLTAGQQPDEPDGGIGFPKKELPEKEPERTPTPVSDSAERMRQFRRIMNEIIMDVMRENNKELTKNITASVSREVEYHMRKREMLEEEHFKQLDRTLREYQLGQKQAAVAKECSRRESKFFKKNGKVRI